jgi:hypothetical protein
MNDDPRDPEVQRALQDAVSDVRPRGGLDTIMARVAEERPRRTSSLAVVLAAAAAMVLILGGIAYLNKDNQTNVPQPSGGGPRSPVVEAYYLGPHAHYRLLSESHRLDNVTVSDVQAAVDEALRGPENPDYRVVFPDRTTAEVKDEGDVVVVNLKAPSDLQSAPQGVPADAGANALQAIVYTVDAALQRPAAVQFQDDGKVVSTILGQPADKPVSRASEDAVLATVSVDLEENAIMPSGTVVSGQAAAFEAAVQWQLKQGDTVVNHGFTTARECCTLSPYDFILKAPPGHYTLVVSDTDPSGGEGIGVSSDSKDITIE